MTDTPVYLDYQATTPVDPSVREAMMPFLGDLFGNPHSSDHSFGWKAARAILSALARGARETLDHRFVDEVRLDILDAAGTHDTLRETPARWVEGKIYRREEAEGGAPVTVWGM